MSKLIEKVIPSSPIDWMVVLPSSLMSVKSGVMVNLVTFAVALSIVGGVIPSPKVTSEPGINFILVTVACAELIGSARIRVPSSPSPPTIEILVGLIFKIAS